MKSHSDYNHRYYLRHKAKIKARTILRYQAKRQQAKYRQIRNARSRQYYRANRSAINQRRLARYHQKAGAQA